jgi:hypothetical protein
MEAQALGSTFERETTALKGKGAFGTVSAMAGIFACHKPYPVRTTAL